MNTYEQNITNIKTNLEKLCGFHVRLVNETNDNYEPGKIGLHVCGKLEGPDDDGSFYVRINDDPQGHGWNGVSFGARNIVDLCKQTSGIWCITLKG